MFGFFKKKKNKDFMIEKSVRETLLRTSQMMALSLQMTQSSKDYETKLNSPFCRGYIFGFFDAALQYSEANFENDDQFASALVFGHMALFGKDQGFKYFVESNAQQDHANFQNGRSVGGNEYFEYINGKIKGPYRIQDYIFNSN